MTAHRPTKLYRIPEKGKILGICAGIADYWGVSVTAVRFGVIVGTIFGFPWVLVGYFILGFVLENKPAGLYSDDKEEEIWRQARTSPDYTAADMRRRFRDIERRTANMEAYMTSKRFKLEREISRLED